MEEVKGSFEGAEDPLEGAQRIKPCNLKHYKREIEERAGVGFATQAVGPVP